MTIGYTLGIPAPNNNPSADQPNMQANNDANSAIWSIDHVTFGGNPANPAGTHNHLTFSTSQPTPVLPTGQSQIYPQDFGTTTTYLEMYNEFTDSTNAVHYGYIPTIKAMVTFTVAAQSAMSQTLTLPTNTLQVNVSSVTQIGLNIATITINFTNALPYNTYYIFTEPQPLSTFLTVTRNTSSIVLQIGVTASPGATFGFMVI